MKTRWTFKSSSDAISLTCLWFLYNRNKTYTLVQNFRINFNRFLSLGYRVLLCVFQETLEECKNQDLLQEKVQERYNQFTKFCDPSYLDGLKERMSDTFNKLEVIKSRLNQTIQQLEVCACRLVECLSVWFSCFVYIRVEVWCDWWSA